MFLLFSLVSRWNYKPTIHKETKTENQNQKKTAEKKAPKVLETKKLFQPKISKAGPSLVERFIQLSATVICQKKPKWYVTLKFLYTSFQCFSSINVTQRSASYFHTNRELYTLREKANMSCVKFKRKRTKKNSFLVKVQYQASSTNLYKCLVSRLARRHSVRKTIGSRAHTQS